MPWLQMQEQHVVHLSNEYCLCRDCYASVSSSKGQREPLTCLQLFCQCHYCFYFLSSHQLCR